MIKPEFLWEGKRPDEVKIVEGVTVPCWKCFRMSSAGFTADDEPVMTHETPCCDAWEKIESVDDASDYLARCRAAMTS